MAVRVIYHENIVDLIFLWKKSLKSKQTIITIFFVVAFYFVWLWIEYVLQGLSRDFLSFMVIFLLNFISNS